MKHAEVRESSNLSDLMAQSVRASLLYCVSVVMNFSGERLAHHNFLSEHFTSYSVSVRFVTLCISSPRSPLAHVERQNKTRKARHLLNSFVETECGQQAQECT